MLKSNSGFGILEALISAGILLTVMLLLMRGTTQNKKATVNLSAAANCENFSASLVTNVKSFDNALKIRNYQPGLDAINVDRVIASSSSYPNDYFCRTGREPVCDTVPHFQQPPGGAIQVGNYQNIRSAATWAGSLYNGYNNLLTADPTNGCRRSGRFFTVTTADKMRFAGVMPAPLPVAGMLPSSLPELPEDLMSVRVTIDQVARQGVTPPTCTGDHSVRPNGDYSFNIYFDVEMKTAINADNNPNPQLRTPNKVCRSTANIGYMPDRTPAGSAQSLLYANGTPLPAVTPPAIVNACSVNPANNFATNRDLRLSLSSSEPGTQFLCNINSAPQWTSCLPGLLAFGTQPATLTPFPGQLPENSPTGIVVNWTNLADGDYRIQSRAVDTAGNCANGGAGCETDIQFRVRPNCDDSFRINYCINEFPPTGCGGFCPLPGLRPPNCPDTTTYYSCESRCDRNCGSQEFNCGNNYGSVWSGRVGNKPFACPSASNPNAFCPSVQFRDPCGAGTLCPAGTYNGCEDQQLCNDDVDVCGTPCTGGQGRPDCDPVTGDRLVPGSGPNPGAVPLSKVCLGSTARRPDGSTFTVATGGIPNTCPAPSTYCSNQIMVDACGQPCAAEGTLAIGCCDRCNSAINSFESVQECQNAGFTNCTPGVVGSSRCVQGS
jgi:hypothetical protein